MNLIYDIVKEKELIPRKKVTSIIEKILRYLGYDFLHDRYKEIVYLESTPITSEEHYIKSLYDGFMYLLTNYKTTITNTLLKKFLYIITNEIYDDYMLSKIATRYFEIDELSPIDKAVDIGIQVYSLLKNIKDLLLITYMILCFILVKHDIPCVQITRKNIQKMELFLTEKDKTGMTLFLYQMIMDSKYMPKTYYMSLKEISFEEVYHKIKEQEEYLRKNYKIEEVILYGSVVKRINRIDSDIDLLVKMSDDMTYKMKKEFIDNAKKYLTNIFNRFVDIEEKSSIMQDDLLIEFIEYKKIY